MKHLVFTIFSIFLLNITISNAAIIYVDANNSVNGDGSSWLSTLQNLQAAIDLADEGDEIWVATGTYYPTKLVDLDQNAVLDDREATFHITKNIKIYGGFMNGDTFNDRDTRTNICVLEGNLGAVDNIGDNAYHVVTVDGTTGRLITAQMLLDGFTIQNGQASDFQAYVYQSGGGLFTYADGAGNEATPSINDCIFKNNYGNGGGAAAVSLFAGKAEPTFSNCFFLNNLGGFSAGAVENEGSANTTTLYNCLFYKNFASLCGGAVYAKSGNIKIDYCTFVENSIQFDPRGAALCVFSGNMEVNNSIVWENFSEDVPNASQLSVFGGGTMRLANTLIGGNENVTEPNDIDYVNTIENDPLFIDQSLPAGIDGILGTADDGLSLMCTSPAINFADNILFTPEQDIVFNERKAGKNSDLGAYEAVTCVVPISSLTIEICEENDFVDFATVEGAVAYQVTIEVAEQTIVRQIPPPPFEGIRIPERLKNTAFTVQIAPVFEDLETTELIVGGASETRSMMLVCDKLESRTSTRQESSLVSNPISNQLILNLSRRRKNSNIDLLIKNLRQIQNQL
ncbi:MAG: hypothetical protein AAGG68_15540, partial [Bacteroidota bacterium]